MNGAGIPPHPVGVLFDTSTLIYGGQYMVEAYPHQVSFALYPNGYRAQGFLCAGRTRAEKAPRQQAR